MEVWGCGWEQGMLTALVLEVSVLPGHREADFPSRSRYPAAPQREGMVIK